MEVAAKLKKYIQTHNISQHELSRLTGIALPKLNLALNSKRRMTFDEFAKILGATGTTADEFITPIDPVDYTDD